MMMPGFFSFMARELREAGAGKVNHALISPEKADLKKAQDIFDVSRYRFYQRWGCGEGYGGAAGKGYD